MDPPNQPSTLLNLAAELRKRIFELALYRDKDCLASFKAPAVCQVSRQVRHEALPVFFDECGEWKITINAYTRAKPFDSSGRLYLHNPRVRIGLARNAALLSYDSAARFQAVVFCFFESRDVYFRRRPGSADLEHRPRFRPWRVRHGEVLNKIWMHVTQGQIHISSVDLSSMRIQSDLISTIQRTNDRAMRKIRSLNAGREFQGLEYAELGVVASVCQEPGYRRRLEPPHMRGIH